MAEKGTLINVTVIRGLKIVRPPYIHNKTTFYTISTLENNYRLSKKWTNIPAVNDSSTAPRATNHNMHGAEVTDCRVCDSHIHHHKKFPISLDILNWLNWWTFANGFTESFFLLEHAHRRYRYERNEWEPLVWIWIWLARHSFIVWPDTATLTTQYIWYNDNIQCIIQYISYRKTSNNICVINDFVA